MSQEKLNLLENAAKGGVWEDFLQNGLPRSVGKSVRNGFMEIYI